MGLFFKATAKELLKDRNTLFKEVGIKALEDNGFARAVFKTSWDGEYNRSIQGYIYQLGRILEKDILEIIDVYIINSEPWIQIYLNVFKLFPEMATVSVLKNIEGLSFGVPPNTLTRMRLRNDDYKGPPLFYMLFLPEHKIGTYFTKSGYEIALEKLKKLIKSDLENIDSFVKRWHELHAPSVTDWEGNPLKNIKDLNFNQKVLFACILSSRLIKNYNVFSLKFGFGSTQVLTSIMDKVVNSISELGQISPEEIDKMIVEIDKITPDTEDFDSVLVSLALDACVSVVSILQFLKDKNVKCIEDIKTCTFDSVDNFIQESLDLDFNDNEFESKIANNELMIKERLFQQNLINEILGNSNDNNEVFLNFSQTLIFDLRELE